MQKENTMKKQNVQNAVAKKQNTKADAKQNTKKQSEAKSEAKQSEAKRQSIESVRDEMLKQIKTTESIVFENEATAKNKIDCAMNTLSNAIVLTNVSADKTTATRLCEVYLHRGIADILFSKRVFERLTTTSEKDSEAIKTVRKTLVDAYNKADEKKRDYKSKKRIFVENKDVVALLNSIITIA